MLDFLRTIFGDSITVTEFHFSDATPFYIRDGYCAYRLSWNDHPCVVLSPVSPSWRLPTLKKQLMKFQEICTIPCALCLDHLTSSQRRNLVENNIPFISLSQQIYLPFWGCAFHEQFKSQFHAADKMSPGTQLVFLYLYYLQTDEQINLTRISKDLLLSKATCTRAIHDLTSSGLLKQKAEGTNKWIFPAYEKPELLKKGYDRLKSPVDRVIYVKELPENQDQIKSGLLALADFSMVAPNVHDGAIAVSKKAAAKIPVEYILSKQEFHDFGGYVIEVWSYDPLLLTHTGRVDDISLLLSLDSDSDERVQMGLDEIREKHELPIRFDE